MDFNFRPYAGRFSLVGGDGERISILVPVRGRFWRCRVETIQLNMFQSSLLCGALLCLSLIKFSLIGISILAPMWSASIALVYSRPAGQFQSSSLYGALHYTSPTGTAAANFNPRPYAGRFLLLLPVF